MDTCVLAVVEGVRAPLLTACEVHPSEAAPGVPVTFTGIDAPSIMGQPSAISIQWGDGETANSLPAMHHYDVPGVYTITATARSPYGSDTCTAEVTVTEPD